MDWQTVLLWSAFIAVAALLAVYTDPVRQYHRELKKRDRLDDDAFVSRYYGDGAIPSDIPVRLRKVFEQEYDHSMECIRPTDNLPLVHDDIESISLVKATETEFDLTIPDDVAEKIDGRFDSIVRFLAMRRLADKQSKLTPE